VSLPLVTGRHRGAYVTARFCFCCRDWVYVQAMWLNFASPTSTGTMAACA